MLAKLRGRPAHVNNRDCQNLEKILEVLYGVQRIPIIRSGKRSTYLDTGSPTLQERFGLGRSQSSHAPPSTRGSRRTSPHRGSARSALVYASPRSAELARHQR